MAADTDDDSDGVLDAADAYPLINLAGAVDTDGDGRPNDCDAACILLGMTADPDDDNDGMSDSFEATYGLNSKLADATGRYTSVSLGNADAFDVQDGVLSASPDNSGPFSSGVHDVIWTATDAAGNKAQARQILRINPLVSLSAILSIAEGKLVSVPVILSGNAPQYPVEIPFTLTGTATLDADYQVATTAVVILSGLTSSIEFTILDDGFAGEGDEIIEVTLGTPISGAVLSTSAASQVTIFEQAVVPSLQISVSQGDSKGRSVAVGGGTVTASLTINDPNGTHTVDWTRSANSLVPTGATDALLKLTQVLQTRPTVTPMDS